MARINKREDIDHEYEILEFIKDNPGGVTVSDIVKNKGYSRNTVSKYVAILDIKGKVFNKKVGAYKQYFSTKKHYLPFDTSISYYKAILLNLKEEFPDMQTIAKKMGRNSVSHIIFPFGPTVKRQLRALKNHPITKAHLEAFATFYAAYDIFQPEVKISILEDDENGQRAVYRFTNSLFLEDSDDYIYHLYLMAGITEGILENAISRKVSVDVKNVHIGKNREQSYFDLEIQIAPLKKKNKS